MLITTLCKNAGVIWDNNEALLHPSSDSDDNMIYAMPSWSNNVQGEAGSARASSSRALKPSTPRALRSNLNMAYKMTQLESNFQ